MVLDAYRTLPLTIFLLVRLCFLPLHGQSQSGCPNSNFTLGDFTGWQGFYGDFKDPALHQGFALTRHTILRAPVAPDLHSCDSLNPIAPGEIYSARLGNDIGHQAEQLKYTVNVTGETNLFIYKYAVVFENQPHNPDEQPDFTIEVTDSSGQIIDPECGFYTVYARTGIPSWHSCQEVVWKDWTIVGIDLTSYIGQAVTIVFTTRDCSLGIHFGYAYLSAFCSKAMVTYSFCPGDTIAILTAPHGFSYAWSNGDTTQSTIIHNPVAGMTDSCVLTSVNGCKVTVRGTLVPVTVTANFQCTQRGCTGTEVRFYDSSTLAQPTRATRIWNFGDGSPVVTNIPDPWHVYTTTGIFPVTLIVSCDGGCPDTITKMVEIIQAPVIHFTATSSCDENTEPNTLYFTGKAQLGVTQGYDHYAWNTGDTTGSILVTAEGWYRVTITSAAACQVTDSMLMLQCSRSLMLPGAFTPDGDGLNDLFRPAVRDENILRFHMLIVDRWGAQIFETSDINAGWDGTAGGSPAPPNVYVYTITYESTPGVTKKINGTVTLVR